MTRYSSTMTEALQEIREGFSTKQIKMAIGIASDKRYAGGNMTGAVKAIEKIKKGLSDHPQVAAVLKRQNEDLEEAKEVLSRFRDDKLKKSVMSLAKQKGLKVKDMGDKIEISGNGRKVMDLTLAVQKHDVKIEELEEKLGKDADAGDYIDDFKKSDAPQFKGKSDKKKRDMAIAAYLDAKDKKEEVELDEAKYDLYHKDFSSAMQHAYAMAKKLHGITIDPKEIDNKVATGPRKPGTGKTNTYRLKGDKGNIQIQVYNKGGSKPFELNMYKEEVQVDEGMKYTHVAVDKKGLVIGFASDEKDAKDMAKRNDGKVVKLKKPMSDKKGDMMVNRPFKEEDEKKMDKPDSAKAVDQARDDKKKTRIAQLQLQIAKASEMINKLNSQEKPDA